jgi:hypothetical protein
LFQLLAIAAGVFVLRHMLWRAILFVAPRSLRIEEDEPAGKEKLPEALRDMAEMLTRSGFRSIGSHLETPWFGRALTCFDFSSETDRTFATLFLDRDKRPSVYFLSRIEPEGFVISADHRRPARNEPGRYLSGGLENFPIDRVYKAHLRLIEGLPLDSRVDASARIDAAREWLNGPGRKEIRQQNFPGLLWTVWTLGMVVGVILR